jgi:hypothetical protein
VDELELASATRSTRGGSADMAERDYEENPLTDDEIVELLDAALGG